MVAHRDLDQAGAGLLSEDRDEAVHLAIERDRFGQIALHDAQRASRGP